MTDRERFEAWMADDLYGEDSCAFMRDKWGYVDPEVRRAEVIWQASRVRALQDAYDAIFDIKGDKATRFDAQTAIRHLANPEGEQG